MLILAGVNSQHEIYEDLGLGSAAQLDQSFNINNFNVLNMSANDPARHLAIECSLSGTTTMYEHARHLSTGIQSPYSVSGPTGSISASPRTPSSRATSAMGMAPISMAPITEQSCTDSDPLALLNTDKAMDTFHLPTWDQLPAEFQNPTASAGFESTIPINTTSASAMDMSSSSAPTMAWDDNELSFDMDMDLDFATEMANAGMAPHQ
jgi:hypothetical protein